MSDLASMREQVYADPRPKEYFDRFHERARTREPDWTYDLTRVLTSIYAYTFLRVRAISLREGAGRGRGDPRAEPLLVHGPLPDGLLHPAQGPLHGQVAAVQKTDAVRLHPRWRVPGRRGARDEEMVITAETILARGGAITMYCEGGRSRTGKVATEAKRGIGRLALETGAPVVPIAIHGSSRIRNWKRLQFPKTTVQYGDPVRWERIPDPTREQQQAVADEILLRDPGAVRRPGRARPQGRAGARARAASRRAQVGQAHRRRIVERARADEPPPPGTGGCVPAPHKSSQPSGWSRMVASQAPVNDAARSRGMNRSIDIGSVISRTFSIYADQASVLLPAAAAVFVVVGVISALLVVIAPVLAILAFIVILVGTTLFTGMVVELVADVQDGRRDATVGQLLNAATPFVGQLILVGIVAGIGIAIGFVLIIIPGLILLTIWSVFAPVIVLENPGGLKPLGRSRELVKGNGWQVFGVIVVLVIGVGIVSAIIEAIGDSGGTAAGIVVRVIVEILTAPISALAASVLYFELRGEKAGGTPEPDPSGPFQAGGFPPAAP